MNGPPQILFGRQRVQGINVGASGSPIDRLKLIGSYTFLQSNIVRHTSPYLVGQRMPNTPAHSLASGAPTASSATWWWARAPGIRPRRR